MGRGFLWLRRDLKRLRLQQRAKRWQQFLVLAALCVGALTAAVVVILLVGAP